MENLTKKQALQKIEELRNYVEQLERKHPAEIAITEIGRVPYSVPSLVLIWKELHPTFDYASRDIVVFLPNANTEWFFAAQNWASTFCQRYTKCFPRPSNDGCLHIAWRE